MSALPDTRGVWNLPQPSLASMAMNQPKAVHTIESHPIPDTKEVKSWTMTVLTRDGKGNILTVSLTPEY
jgi:hypothetical protein